MTLKNKIIKKLYYQYVATTMSVFSRWPIGTNVFELDWDVLLILDTCRIDALQELSDEYGFLNSVGSITSVGSSSSEWISCTFTDEYEDLINKTVYVSANAYAERVLVEREFPDSNRGLSWSNWNTIRADELLELDQPWKYAPNPHHGHIRPNHITDRAIANHRKHKPERMIVHYSQPHPPYTANADNEDRELYEYEKDPWSYLKSGGDEENVWNAYLDNLRMVLDQVEIIIDNIDAEKVAISADHGEAFGEWGIYWHPMGVLHPKLRKVPWVETTAHDSGEYEPKLDPDEMKDHKRVNEHLEDLGYIK